MKTSNTPQHATPQQSLQGVAFSATAFLIWGMSPLFWKTLSAVPSFEIIMHRMIWSFLFLAPIMLRLDRWQDFLRAMADRRTLLTLTATTFIVGSNWLVFIWAINHDQVLQASLGYYINPLVNVLLGMIFLGERLRTLQAAAVVFAGSGVLFLTLSYGQFPWIALYLAFSFGFYGLLRKTAKVDALVGLSVETFLLSVPAISYLVFLETQGNGAFGHISLKTDLSLAASALMTAVPLLLFTMGARRLNLSTVGFLQYIAPTCAFLLAVFVFREPIGTEQWVTFAAIWTALIVFTADALRHTSAAASAAE